MATYMYIYICIYAKPPQQKKKLPFQYSHLSKVQLSHAFVDVILSFCRWELWDIAMHCIAMHCIVLQSGGTGLAWIMRDSARAVPPGLGESRPGLDVIKFICAAFGSNNLVRPRLLFSKMALVGLTATGCRTVAGPGGMFHIKTGQPLLYEQQGNVNGPAPTYAKSVFEDGIVPGHSKTDLAWKMNEGLSESCPARTR